MPIWELVCPILSKEVRTPVVCRGLLTTHPRPGPGTPSALCPLQAVQFTAAQPYTVKQMDPNAPGACSCTPVLPMTAAWHWVSCPAHCSALHYQIPYASTLIARFFQAPICAAFHLKPLFRPVGLPAASETCTVPATRPVPIFSFSLLIYQIHPRHSTSWTSFFFP